MAWCFDDFTLDEECRQLLRAGVPIRLEPKAYELLSLLVARRPRVLSKDQIHNVLWPGTFVSDSALAGVVADLRSALGDAARRPRYIRTVHGFGYAFCAEVREAGHARAIPAAPVLRTLVLSGSQPPRALDSPFSAVLAAIDEPAGAAVHIVEFSAGSRPPVVLQQLASLAQPAQVLLSRAVFDLARDGADQRGVGLVWLAHGLYLFQAINEPVEVFEVGRPGTSFLKPPPDTVSARRARRPEDDAMLGWRPALDLSVPGREGWTFIDKLGEGGFGEVWLARHPSGERRVFKFCFEAARLRGLKREATLFRLLKEELGERDDIARVLDWNFDEPPYFLESEYTEGGSLVDWGRAAGGIAAIPLAIRVMLVAQVAEALAAAHSVGVLHKDVKPQNILITEDRNGRPKARLTDFGIGLVRDTSVLLGRDFTVTGFTTDTTDPISHRAVGTRLYAAPEVLEGKTATTLADIYALGVVLYQMVVGDLERALAPGWERDVADDLLKDDIGVCVEGRPERRLGNALHLADRLRRLDERRAEKQAPRRRRRNRRALTVVALLTMGALCAAFFSVGARLAERPIPRFQRITFQPDSTGYGRFTPDGGAVFYGRMGGFPTEVFSVRLDSVESRSRGIQASVTAVTASEMAVILPNDTLARLPFDGGAPREITEHVRAADWAPDGGLAILRGPHPMRVEYPMGHVLYQGGSLSLGENVRISPRGDRVAFIDHPSGESVEGLAPGPGHLVIVDRQGHPLVSSEWSSIGGLAWSPDGREVWFTATKTHFTSALHALLLDGRERLVAQMGETIYLHDISRDGRVLIAQGRISSECRGRIAGDSEERSYSWLDGTTGARFSRDGRLFIFSEVLDGAGPGRRAYLRGSDGASPPVWLGEGTAMDISADGKWVLCMSHQHPRQLRLVPVGAGEAHLLPQGMLDGFRNAFLLPDGKRIVALGSAEGRSRQLFVQDLPDGAPRPVSPEGLQIATAISPDGRFAAAATGHTRPFRLYPLDGGEPHDIPGATTTDMPVRFSADGAALFVYERLTNAMSRVRIARLDLHTGRRTPWLEFTSPNQRALDVGNVDITPDGRSYIYCFDRFLSDLYIVDGLR